MVEAIYALFSDHNECKSRAATRDFLKSAERENDPRLLKQFTTWADKAISKVLSENDFVLIQADTPATLLGRLASYTSESTEDEGLQAVSLWPVVSGVRICFDNPLSKMGVHLLDVPGSSDSHIRRKVANAIVRQSTHAAITVPASRANSGNSVSKEIKAVKNKGDGRLMVIVTCSDEIDEDTVIGGTPRERQKVKEFRKEIDSVKKQLNVTKLQQRHAKTLEEEQTLYDQVEFQAAQLSRVEGRETALRISMRGQKTRETIQRKLADVTDFDKPIPVFWLSNLPYRKYRAGYYPDEAPALSVEETNGPAIRCMISEFPNVARLKQVEHAYKVQLPMLFTRIELFSTRAPADIKADLEGYVHSPIERSPAMMRTIWTKARADINANVIEPVKSGEEHWIERAGALCDRWAQEFKSAQEMLSLMNTDGHRRGRLKKREINVSGDLQAIASARLNAHFLRLLPVMKDLEAEIKSDIDHLCSGIIDNIGSEYLASQRQCLY